MEAREFVYKEHGGSWTFSQMWDKAGVVRTWVAFSSKAGHIVSVLFPPMTCLLPLCPHHVDTPSRVRVLAKWGPNWVRLSAD